MKQELQGRLRERVAVLLCVLLVGVGIDQISKIWAVHTLSDGNSISVIPHVLRLTLVYNPGMSLGMFSAYTWVIGLISIVASMALAAASLLTTSRAWCIACAIACAGALGNCIDRVVYATNVLDGAVVDFLDYGWSVGNIADVILVIAAVVIIVLLAKGVPFGNALKQDTAGSDTTHVE